MDKRELGVRTVPCHSCGKALPGVERPDGSVAAVPCDGACKKPQATETAAKVDSVFSVREHGDVVEPAEEAPQKRELFGVLTDADYEVDLEDEFAEDFVE